MTDETKQKEKEVQFLVNEKPVQMADKHTTGREIKAAAIAQQVAIQMDFVLSEELNDRRSRIIGDADAIQLHAHSRFIAVAPDDNS